ncbi:MAG TPA: glycosyltransferase family 39 protein [Gemmataceae bacterium]|nr:glycosyltransferase family 39 protein [Gemmataceae bacterium]
MSAPAEHAPTLAGSTFAGPRPGWSIHRLVAWSPGHLVTLSLFCGFLFFHRLADRDLWNSHEARAAQDAQTILDDGCWGLPRLFDGRPELQKPPLYYWLVAGAACCRGGVVDAWAVRLPAAVAALGCVLLVYSLLRRRGRPIAGLTAALVLATAMHFTWLARVGRIDMPLTLAVSVALLGGLWLNNGSFGWTLLAYLAIAAGLLLKGPIAVVLPAAVAAVHLLTECLLRGRGKADGTGRPVTWSSLWWGVPLVLGLTVPWYVWANVQTAGEFWRVFFWHHNIERGLGGSERLRAHPWWFYGPQLLLDWLPWSPFLLVAGWWLVRRGWWRADAEARFGLVWLVTMAAVLSCFRFKRADYLLPAYPGAALFLGCVMEHWLRETRRPRCLAAGFALVVGMTTASWLVYVDWNLPRWEPCREYRRFAAEIRRRAPAPERILFFRTEAHALAFHVGRPLDVLVWWDDLDAWAARPGVHYVVMPPTSAGERQRWLRSARLEEVLSNSDLVAGGHEKPLVLLRTCPLPGE